MEDLRDELSGPEKELIEQMHIDWPVSEPFTLCWNRIMKSSFTREIHKGKDLKESIEFLRSLYLSRKWSFGPADVIEMMVDHVMAQDDVRVYKLSKTLAEALLRTSIKKVPSNFIRVPFPRIYLDFSEIEIPVKIDYHEGTVRGLLLEKDEGYIRTISIRYIPENKGSFGQSWPFAFNLMHVPLLTDDDFQMPSLKEIVKSQAEADKLMEAGKAAGLYTTTHPEHPRDRSVFRATRLSLHLMLATLMYVNSVNADIKLDWYNSELGKRLKGKHGRSRRDLERHLEKEGKIYQVGSGIKIPNVSLPSSGESTPTGRKISVRFRVRGHFHLFWVGSRKDPAERTLVLKWIESYYKGPEMAQVVEEKIFEVGRRKDGKAEVGEDRIEELESLIEESLPGPDHGQGEESPA